MPLAAGLSGAALDFKLWDKLGTITKMESLAKCRSIPPSYEPRKGQGEVVAQKKEEGVITFFEKGKWTGVHSKEQVAYTNLFRWSLNPSSGEITLGHLRFGTKHPVILLTLAQVEKHLYKSLHPHECKEDTYTASVLFDDHFVHLHWRVIGPKKNEHLAIVYF